MTDSPAAGGIWSKLQADCKKLNLSVEDVSDVGRGFQSTGSILLSFPLDQTHSCTIQRTWLC